MSQVCRHWRSTVMSYPLVWTDVAVKKGTPESRVTAALGNSRGLPLNLDLQIHWNKGKPESFAILSLIEPHQRRIHSLQIRFSYHGGSSTFHCGVTQLIQHPFFGGSFDVLDSLSLSFVDMHGARRHPFASPTGPEKIEGDFPQLKTLALSGTRYILHPNLRCPVLESLSTAFTNTRGHWSSEEKETDFFKQHSDLISLTIKGQAIAQPVRFDRLKSVTLSGGGFQKSIGNGVHPTFMTVITSLTIRVADPTTITASDGDGNSIACSTPHADRPDIVEVWRAYLGFAQDGVEDVYLDLEWDTDAPYDVLRGLSNVKAVYIAWTGDRTERIIERVAGALTHPSRRPQNQINHRGPGIWRWVECEEDIQTATLRDKSFESYVGEWGLRYRL